ncbi:restriction endonuclease subunit S [Antarcticibacterium flavum]|uniref:Restriction endonuclease subunit S n=1 Tax=Antarcticibacterium flavum TaxID=2058175 RepID=A0A5B7X129_9FLAO|nr:MULTISPECIES: restriction endonuclease subunit S [Antarcticibacterium]QCY69067.1 restriction endonuclease subunit S [Antarcticibacterium flavum]
METEVERNREQKIAPQLRFREFESNWIKIPLGKIIKSISSGKTKPEDNGKYPVFGSTGIIGNCSYFTHDGEFILIARVGANAGKIQRVIGKFSVTDNTLVLIPEENKLLPKFAELFLMHFNLNKLIFGSGQPLITGGLIKSIKIILPSLPEQQKITSFFSVVNIKLQQVTRKKELLETYKKGVMQQLFSQDIRFKDEDGKDFPEWKWVNGNKLFDNISDKNHNSDLPILAITQDQGAIPRDLINYKITVTKQSVESYKVVQKGDFVISLRTFQGGIEYSDYHGICSPAYIVLRANSKNVDKTFYKLYLKTPFYIKQLQKNLEGIRDGKMISYKYFSEIKLPFPSIEEQQKIAKFLSAIDEKIEAVSQQNEKSQSFKKGLLQQMFV